ncbi:tetratricopeptide repeat protein [Lysobacter sp. SG-8]|uniref:Tetratricopeptide repeat protein n=1 Tax=Marilutibacter penaei TaxID=2759900 RepID=A0A7W3U659_9GAMM|nr:tetratricopeptide repeat protein [Lysobacter penaei]MBB1089390.1 tetratricopeptide repeat protein [Lysobacter penaei]
MMEPGNPATMGPAPPSRYRFADVTVDVAAHTVTRGGEDCALEPKAFAVLLELLRHAGDMVAKDDLLDAVWGHRHVTPGVLTRAIAQLRSALGDDAHDPRFIQTHHALGYRFIAGLEVEAPAPASGAAALPAREDAAAMPDPAGPVTAPARPRAWRWGLAALVLVGALAGAGAWVHWRSPERLPPAEASVAVLPFSTLSGAPGDAYFAEGLAVEMHGALAGVPGLKVAALQPAEGRREGDVRVLGRRLGVATVLDASVRREGQRMRIDARLSDTRNGFVLWSQTYDRDASDIFATQSEIAREVVRALLGVLPPDVPALDRRLRPTADLAAYEPYLHGLNLLRGTASLSELAEARRAFEAALERDPRFARAQAGLCRVGIREFEAKRDVGLYDAAQATCMKAARMDPALGEVSLALGDLYASRGEADAARKAYEDTLHDTALRPAAYIGLGRLAGTRDEDALAMDYFERARQLQPGSAAIHREIGYQHYLKGRLADAIASFRVATTLSPDDAGLWSSLGGLHLANGEREPAAAAFERSLSIEPGFAALSNLGTLRYEQGEYDEAAALYSRASELNPGDYRMVGNIADALAASSGGRGRANAAYRRAAEMAGRYVAIRSDDAEAKAWLAWYRANLDDEAAARRWLEDARRLGTARAEVALLGAMVHARLGDRDAARESMQEARALDVAEARLQAAPVLRQVTGGQEIASQGGG